MKTTAAASSLGMGPQSRTARVPNGTRREATSRRRDARQDAGIVDRRACACRRTPEAAIEVTTALLCDHAQVREGLLFVLSGGVSRVMRDSFPAVMGTCLALVLELDGNEAEQPHHLEIVVVGEDGEEVARVAADVQVGSTAAAKPAESLHIPFAVDLRNVALARAGAYETRVYVDGELRRTLQFWAEPIPGDTLLL
jgi:hypothetical protein